MVNTIDKKPMRSAINFASGVYGCISGLQHSVTCLKRSPWTLLNVSSSIDRRNEQTSDVSSCGPYVRPRKINGRALALQHSKELARPSSRMSVRA